MFKAHVMHISDRVLYDGVAERVLMPGVMGEFEVKSLHAPVVSLLKAGVIVVGLGAKISSLPVKQGLMRFDGKEFYAVVE